MSEPFPDPRTLLRRYGLSAKKSWGQNFLVSERVYRAIVDAVVLSDDDWIVELGAGLGTLTARLAQRVPEGKVLAVERDRELVKVLIDELDHFEEVEIVEANALTYDFEPIARWRGSPIVACGNLPYNIASQLLFRLIEAHPHVSRAVVMIQRELGERLLARPGTKEYGAFGVLIATYADVRRILQVAPNAFWPPPRVDSVVVGLTMLDAPRVDVVDREIYFSVVHAAFEQRRKMLRNALRARFAVELVDGALESVGVDGSRRGETLTMVEFAALASALSGAGCSPHSVV